MAKDLTENDPEIEDGTAGFHKLLKISYDAEFAEDLEKFKSLIAMDADIDKLKLRNTNQRLSAAIRWLIRQYNKRKGPSILALKTKGKVEEHG